MEKSLGLLPQLLGPILLPLLFFLLLKICLHKNSSSKIRLPPGPKPWPVIGSMHKLIGAHPHVKLRDLAKIYGPICHIQVGQLTLVSVTTPEVAEEFLKVHELTYAQRPKLPIFEMTSFEDASMIFSPYGEYWRQIRKVSMMELLGPRRVRSFRSIREEEISGLIGFVGSTCGVPFNVSKKIFVCANSITSKAAFGQTCKRQGEFLSALAEQLRLAGGFSLLEIFPSLQFLYYLNGTKAKLSHIRAVYDDILGSVIADHRTRRKCQGNTTSDEEDLVDVLLRLQESGEMGVSLTDNMLKDIIMDLLGGGSETVPTTVEWAMSEMLKNPNIMMKAQSELREALKKEKGSVEEADLEKIQYLKLIIKETFRLHPPAPLVGRIPREACTVHGYNIPETSRVLINSWAIGRDPNHWENPEKFEPERFLNSSIELGGSHFQLLPFGSGRRVCPGARFATANIELMLANLIYHFDWRLANGLTPEELDMTEAPAVVVNRLNPLYVIATPYSTSA